MPRWFRNLTAFEAALALPALIGLGTAAVLLVAIGFGYRAFAAPADLALPEAVALRDEASVLRQMRQGADPDMPAIIRRGMIRGDEARMTALEAAVEARHLDVLRLMLRNGAHLDDTNLPVLACLARRAAAADIADLLAQHAAADRTFDCAGVRLP